MTALDKAMKKHQGSAYGPALGNGWRDWVRVREVCPVGQSARYSDDQIRYHYTLDRDCLRRGSNTEGEHQNAS